MLIIIAKNKLKSIINGHILYFENFNGVISILDIIIL